MKTKGKVVGLVSNLVTVAVDGPVAQNEICFVILEDGSELMAEVIKVEGVLVDVQVYDNLQDFFQRNDVKDMWCLSTKAPQSYTQAKFTADSYLFFGKETKGLPEDFLEQHRSSCVRLPMRSCARSLNLSNAVAITVYEALRQTDFQGLQDYGKMREESPDKMED